MCQNARFVSCFTTVRNGFASNCFKAECEKQCERLKGIGAFPFYNNARQSLAGSIWEFKNDQHMCTKISLTINTSTFEMQRSV